MKRKNCVTAAVLSVSLLLTACGSKEYLKDIKAEKYVTLGEYKGITATADKPEVPVWWRIILQKTFFRRRRRRFP